MLLINLLLLISSSYCQEDLTSTVENVKNCRDRNRLITSNKDDIYKLVDATIGQKLILQCHYCSENDDDQPKIWYKMPKLVNSSAEEVHLGMDSHPEFNKIHVNEAHSLVFHNITLNDTGLYYCLGLDEQEVENKYNYLVDIVFENETKSETGNLTVWSKYHEENFEPINKLFANSLRNEFFYIRDQLKLKVELYTEWDAWGPCEVCGRPQGDGQKRKKGLCRLKIEPLDVNQSNGTINTINDDEAFFLHARKISCKSLALDRLFPPISNISKFLPSFVQVEHCEGTCNPDADGLSKGWKTGKSLGFKYRKSYVLARDDHLTLICPEATLENVVIWYRNGKVLKAGKSVVPDNPNDEPKITVDTFNTLYLHGVTSKEEGNYTCEVDKIRMQQVRIFVVSKSRLLTQAFVRHTMYLGFVLSLTLTCYCAGLFVTWKRRHTFMDYDELVQSESQPYQNLHKDEDEDFEY